MTGYDSEGVIEERAADGRPTGTTPSPASRGDTTTNVPVAQVNTVVTKDPGTVSEGGNNCN